MLRVELRIVIERCAHARLLSRLLRPSSHIACVPIECDRGRVCSCTVYEPISDLSRVGRPSAGGPSGARSWLSGVCGVEFLELIAWHSVAALGVCVCMDRREAGRCN